MIYLRSVKNTENISIEKRKRKMKKCLWVSSQPITREQKSQIMERLQCNFVCDLCDREIDSVDVLFEMAEQSDTIIVDMATAPKEVVSWIDTIINLAPIKGKQIIILRDRRKNNRR